MKIKGLNNYRVKIDLTIVNKKLKEEKGKKTLTVFQKEQIKLKKDFLKKIVQPQLDSGNVVLKLSDNKEIANELNITERKAKRIKDELSKMGIINVPEYGKQKKKGDFPIWLINYDFTYLVSKENKRKIRSTEELYRKEFVEIERQAKQEAREFYEEVEESTRFVTGDETYELNVTARDFSILKNKIIKEKLNEIGKTRQDFKK